MLKGKRSKLFLLLVIAGGYTWLLCATLFPPLPTAKKPLYFYSTHTRDDLKKVVLSALGKAQSSIFLQIYGLTDPEIIALLLQKKREGVNVCIRYDKTASQSLPKELEAQPVRSKGLMHRKILVIDQALCLMGTANFTPQSLKMHGNLLLGLYAPELAQTLSDESTYKTAHFESFLLPDKENQALTRLCQSIETAQKSIQIAIFTLTHPQIIEHLITAHKRGVTVTLCVDRYTAQGASRKALSALKEAGITILHSQGDQLLHHKWALIDQKTLIMGSANWTLAAFQKNHDSLWVIENLQPTENKKLQKIWKTIENACQIR